jgi:hypothetical protein
MRTITGMPGTPRLRRPLLLPARAVSASVKRLSANLRKIRPRTGIEYSAALRWEFA